MSKAKPVRLWEIDTLRGVAVILMALFHLFWNLQHFSLSQIDVLSGGWQIFARAIGSTFMGVLGVSLWLDAARRAQTRQQLWTRNLRRMIILLACASLVTIATVITTPTAFVRFGILHLAAVAVVLGTPFVQAPQWVSLVGGITVLLSTALIAQASPSTSWLIPFGVVPPGVSMVDYYPIVPWFGMSLLGIAFGKWFYPNGNRRFTLPQLNRVPFAPLLATLQFLGRHSLAVYLLHQPILYGLVLVVTLLI